MPRINNNGANQPPIRNERNVTNTGAEGSRDEAHFDTGRVRYDWDIYGDAQGDRRGDIGLGHNDGRNDIYGNLEFNEDTDLLKGSLRGSRRINDYFDMRGLFGLYDDGDMYGDIGANYHNDDGAFDAEYGYNERTRTRRVAVTGRYRVGEDTRVRGAYRRSVRNTKTKGDTVNETWKLGARHRLDTGHFVDAEVGRHSRNGRYVEGEWSRDFRDGAERGDIRDRVRFGYSERNGLNASYEGKQRFDSGYISEDFSYGDGTLRGGVKGRRELDDGYFKGATNFERREDGRWSGDASGERRLGDNLFGGRVRRDLSGLRKYKAYAGREVSDSLDAKVTGNLDSRGRWDVTGELDKDLGNKTDLRERVTFDYNGRRTYNHRITKRFDANNTRLYGEVEHSSDGARNVALGVSTESDAGARHSVDGSIGRNAKGEGHGEIEYSFDDRKGFRGAVDAGFSGDNKNVGLDLDKRLDNNRGTNELDVDWSTKKGLEAGGGLSRNIGDDTSVSGSVKRNFRDGDLSAAGEVSTKLGEDDDIALKVGGKARTKDGSRSANVMVGRTASKDDIGFNAGVGFTRDKKKAGVELSAGLNSKDLFGLGEIGTLGGSHGVQVTKRARVGKEAGAIGTLREEVLSEAGENAAFVRYGMKSTSKANVGVKVPIGVGYVDTGYKAGRSYEVEFTRLENDPEVGGHPDRKDLEIPDGADGLLAMKAGESFAIKGHTAHAVRGGAGLGTNIGVSSVGDVGIRAGGKMTYAIAGETRTEVTRGGDGSARMVVKATDSRSRGAGLEVHAGLNPNLPGVPGLEKAGPIGDVATGLASGMIKKWVSVGGWKGKETTHGDERLLDARIDLNHAEARSAYETAMKGDWSELETLNASNHPGVQIDKSLISDIDKEVEGFDIHGLGMGYDKKDSQRIKSSAVVERGRAFEVESDLDVNSTKKDGWFVDKDFEVQDFSRTIEAKDGGDLGRRKAEEHFLGWSASETDSFTSKEELLDQLALARFVGGEDAPKELADYSKKIGKMEEKRKLWVGPRNELKETSVKTEIMFADAALDRLSGKTSDEIWAAMSKAQQALGGNEPAPDWTDSVKRNALQAGVYGLDPRTGRRENNRYEQKSFEKTRAFVDRIAAASRLPEEQRNDAIRMALASRPRDSVAIAAMVELLGRDAIEMKVSVDSNAGKKGSEYDLDFKLRGEDFNIQKTVFGSNL